MQEGKSRERAERVAAAVLSGKRHRGVGKAMFFHTAGRTYRFENMHYVAVAGGNAFYERKPTRRQLHPAHCDRAGRPAGFDRGVALGRNGSRRIGTARESGGRDAHAGPDARAAHRRDGSSRAQPMPVSIEALILAEAGF